MSLESSPLPYHQTLLRELEQRGAIRGDSSAKGGDIALEADLYGRPAVFNALSSNVSVMGGRAFPSEPTFFRLDLGSPARAPTRWAVWTVSRTGTYGGQDWSGELLVQAAEGLGSLSIAVHRYVSEVPTHAAVELLFEVLDELDTESGRAETSSSRRFDSGQALTGFSKGKKRDKGLRLLAGSALGFSMTSLATGVVLSILGMPELGFIVAAGGSTSALPYLLASSSRRRDPGRALDATLMDTLRTSKIFDDVAVTGEGAVVTVPAITDGEAGRQGIAGALKSSLIEASSKKRPLEVRLGRWIFLWPPSTLPICQLLPSSWVVCELRNDEAALIQAPDWERQERSDDALRWLFTGEEISGGALDDLLVVLARRVLGAGESPYR